jgi:hypothetical protein
MDAAQLAILDHAIEWAELHPEEHDQGMYVIESPSFDNNGEMCGTKFCLAGKIDYDAGAVVTKRDSFGYLYLGFDYDTYPHSSWEEYASEVLGINYRESYDGEQHLLFREYLTLDNIKENRDKLAEKYGHPVAYR